MKRRRTVDWLGYVALRVVIAVVQSTSLENCQRSVRVLAWWLARYIPLRRSTIDENLKMVMPGITDSQLCAMREATWEHLLLMVCEIDLAPLMELVPKHPRLKLVILNASKALLPKLNKLVLHGQVYVDIAVFDGLAVIEDVLRDIPLERILFGSHSPMFYFESALLKLREAELTQAATNAIRFENAERLAKVVKHGFTQTRR